MDKFALVYEFNKESPLITYKASKEFDAGNYNNALTLLETAIEKFPNHATSYFIYALTLAKKKDFDEAKKILSIANDIWNVKDTYDYYSDQIERIKRSAKGISVNFDETVNEVLNESFLEPEGFNNKIEFDLLDDDTKLDKTEYKSDIEQTAIVTETLAEIYASQQSYKEALDIYEKLTKIKPDLKDKFEKRISELNDAIKNKKQKNFGV